MRTWTRADRVTLCGRCEHRYLSVGEPMLVIQLQGREFIRCERCEGAAPADLPPLVERMPIPVTMLTRFRPSPNHDLPLDFKARGAGDREPGEDG